MGLANVSNNYQPKENPEFGGKKKLVGDAVCQAKLESINGKKDGKEWYMLKSEAINVIPDPKGRPTTVEPGDEITKMYDPQDDESLQELADDLYTAGIQYEKAATDAEVFRNMQKAVDGKLIYFRTWAKELTAEEKVKYPKNTSGFFQNIKVLSSSKVTPENSTPQVAF